MIKNLRIELLLSLLVVIILIAPFSIDFFIYDYFYDFIQLETHSVAIYESGGFHFIKEIKVSGPAGFFPIVVNVNTELVILKHIFEKITNLGSSVWYFSILILAIIITLILKKFKIINLFIGKKIFDISKFSILYLALTGVLTQVLKVILGRARPNYTDFENGLNFEFFSIDSHFHSFPSGHSSSIFCVAIIFGFLFPKIKYFFYFLGCLVAISRVLVGAHFISDVFAGLIITLISYKILKHVSLPLGKFNVGKIEKISFGANEAFFNSLIIFIVVSMVLTASPLIDVIISNLFYLGDNQFYLQKSNYITILFREFYLPFLLVYILLLTIFSRFNFIKKLFFYNTFSFKQILFLWLSSAMSLILIVNYLLKDLWGRVRPNDLAFFEGSFLFTPWYKLTSFCDSNCSFVSGDASVGYLVLVLYFLTKNVWFFYISLFSGSVLGLVRIAEGGHFFSDIVFAQIIISFSIFFFYLLYKKL